MDILFTVECKQNTQTHKEYSYCIKMKYDNINQENMQSFFKFG